MKILKVFLTLSLFSILTSTAVPAQSIQLKWDIPRHERLEMTRTARINYLVNNRLRRVYEERNIIDLTCYDKSEKASSLKGVFSVFHRERGKSVFHLREQYMAEFDVTPLGHFKVGKKDYMPNLRHVPSFPAEDVTVGKHWKSEGALVLNSFSRPFKLIFPVEYKLSEIKEEKKSRIAVIKYKYIINKDLRGMTVPRDFPLRIVGRNAGIIHWDITQNTPVDIEDMYRIVFFLRRGRSFGTIEFRMNMKTENRLYKPVTESQKENAKKEIEKELPKGSGIDVDTEKRGIVLRMGEVLFDFDSAKLRGDTRRTLDKVIDIIRKKYPDREIIVEGHTDSIGSKPYNRKLSNNRARSVAKYLKKGVGHDKFSYRGFGARRPIGDNATKEGRQKNRRVEIIIKLH